ncbi:MAG: 50S ribosomal protein L11 methyltransferase [Candidatus Heimdallarchaeota archaeon]|nr:50S ribosomal protein L11 methyltransferase [Candidatus Heimdallarchaeota archaeon]MCK4953904.1 50S ribosomal protein L11 methyltransferase [Candidatus Heimdallarchaeota archaeon]
MKQKDLEILLSQLSKFTNPKIHLEQYQTPPRLVAMIAWRALQLGDIENKVVADFCSGTGLFAIASKILGAKKVYAFELDPEAMEIAKNNAKMADTDIKFILKDVRDIDMTFNTVLMNSPFGIKGSVKDQEFLRHALVKADTSYSIHLFQEKNITFLKKFVEKHEKKVTEIIKAEFEIPKIFRFHKKKFHIIEVAVLRSL